MAKRAFLQLCHTYKDKEIGSWYLSEKLDGQRAFWDGGVSRGLPTAQVPYANTKKDARLIDEPIATGLWSRAAKVIRAPGWITDMLPPIPLDMELFCGRGENQKMASIVRSHSGNDWEHIELRILDSPPPDVIFENGQIEIRMGNEKYYLYFQGCREWYSRTIASRGLGITSIKEGTGFDAVHKFLKKNLAPYLNEWVKLEEQIQLPPQPQKIRKIIDQKFEEVQALGGEGLVVRSHIMPWVAERSHHILKMKPTLDSEAVVTGFTWGNGKYLGIMGNMIVSWQGKRFELSGLTDAERQMTNVSGLQINEGLENPGKRISEHWESGRFPIGSIVTFKYRELSRDGIPKEAVYFRKRESE
jgi:DNA ligase-1